MVLRSWMTMTQTICLSVLALSSRFDGRIRYSSMLASVSLSVLALSSRFDGRVFCFFFVAVQVRFQYSLCRVVLMVLMSLPWHEIDADPFSTRSVESF